LNVRADGSHLFSVAVGTAFSPVDDSTVFFGCGKTLHGVWHSSIAFTLQLHRGDNTQNHKGQTKNPNPATKGITKA
jgi:hypothetical protein